MIMGTINAEVREEVRELFRQIATGERTHGAFLTAFAKALVCADDENYLILLPAAARLMSKYRLCARPGSLTCPKCGAETQILFLVRSAGMARQLCRNCKVLSQTPAP